MSVQISSVLFVCLGNICRSPSAEAVFRHKAKQQNVNVLIDSAGTAGYHVGSLPDSRSMEAGTMRGYDFSGITCRKLTEQDFENFDLVVAMDRDNLRNMDKVCPAEHKHKMSLFLQFADVEEDEVPDPYYGGKKGFEHVLDLIEAASDGLIQHIKNQA